MAERLTKPAESLGRLSVGRHGKKGGKPKVEFTEIQGFTITQFAFFPEQKTAAKAMLKRQFSVPSMPDPASSCREKGCLCLRPELGKLWLVTEKPMLADLPASMDKYYPLDISASKLCLLVTGPEAGTLINRQAAVDLSCPDGQFMATAMHHVGVHILKVSEDRYLLMLPSSFAESLTDGLFDIACQFGVKVNNPAKGSLKGIEG